MQIIAFIPAHKKTWRLYSYRTQAGAEVDIVLDTGNKLLGIECKYHRHLSESDLSGLRSLAKAVEQPVQKYVVYTGETRQQSSQGEIALPFADFLAETIPQL